jgi:hypothetical protein
MNETSDRQENQKRKKVFREENNVYYPKGEEFYLMKKMLNNIERR